MPIYRKMQYKNRKAPMYTKDGLMIPAQYVPEDIQKILETENEYEDDEKRCIVCLKPGATHTRFADLQVVDLCEDDYYNKRMGEVIQALRKLKEYEHAKKEKVQKAVKEDAQHDEGQDAQETNDGVLVTTKVEAGTVPA